MGRPPPILTRICVARVCATRPAWATLKGKLTMFVVSSQLKGLREPSERACVGSRRSARSRLESAPGVCAINFRGCWGATWGPFLLINEKGFAHMELQALATRVESNRMSWPLSIRPVPALVARRVIGAAFRGEPSHRTSEPMSSSSMVALLSGGRSTAQRHCPECRRTLL